MLLPGTNTGYNLEASILIQVDVYPTGAESMVPMREPENSPC